MTEQITWHRGVPWLASMLKQAEADGVADATTEVARGLIERMRVQPPEPDVDRVALTHGRFTAFVSPELVVIGYGPTDEPEPEPEPCGRKGGHGPTTYRQLVEWLADEGYAVVGGRRGGHLQILDPSGRRVMPLTSSPSDQRSLKNDIAAARRLTGLELRR